MNKVKIITDSTCDISPEKLKELDIDMLSLYVVIKDKPYLDLEEIKWNDVIEKVKEYNELPKTAAVNIETFANKFREYVEEDYDILYVGLGSKFSSTYNNACLASQEFPEGRVTILDSENLSSAIGVMLIKMAKFRDQGLSAKEIADKMKEIIPLTQTETALETMSYLYKGGRCSGMKYLVGRALKFYPIVKVNDGVINVHRLGKLTFKNALNIIASDFRKDLEDGNVDEDFIIISTVGNEKAREYLYNKVGEFFPKEKIFLFDAGCVVSTHCGPGTTGFFYIRKHKVEDEVINR